MKFFKPITFGILMVFLLMATTCGDDDLTLTCDDYVVSLQALESDILELAEASECNETTECRFLSYGVKPCGGPRAYVIYSTSIDTLLIANMVDVYNSIETEYNTICEMVSDCTVPNPPVDFDCEDNNCVPIF